MDNKTIFVRTPKGEDELKTHVANLSGDIYRILLLIGNKSTVEEMRRRAAPSLQASLGDSLNLLVKGGFVRAMSHERSAQAAPINPVKAPNIAVPKMAVPKMSKPASNIGNNTGKIELDFTLLMRPPTPEILAAEAAKLKMQADEKNNLEAEVARIKAEQEKATAREKLEADKIKLEIEERARAEAESRARQEAEDKARAHDAAQAAKQEADAARIKAEQEAEKIRAEMAEAMARMETEAKVLAETEALARREAEAARLKAEQEAEKIRSEMAETKARMEAEAKALAETEALARREAEAARLKVEQEAMQLKAALEASKAEAETRAKQQAEAARIKAEQEAAQVKAALEAARAEAEAKARAEEIARQEAEAARLQAEREAARVKEELEAAKAKADAEDRAEAAFRAEAEASAKQQAEAARLKAEQEAAQVKAALEAAKAEAEAKARAEETARQEAEAARYKAEQEAALAIAALEAARAEAEAEARARIQEEVNTKQQAEAARIKAEQEAAQARAELEAAKVEAKNRAEAEENAKQETRTVRIEAEQEVLRIRSEAEEQVREAAAAKADAAAARSMIATVLFFDVVGYTKQSVSKQIELKAQFNKLVSAFIKDIDESERIILDTGDGAAIGFLHHPEDAIEVAMQFQHAVTANKHQDYPELKVRMGINLGPVSVLKDMNGQINLVGDGINDAQRIMSFASTDHIYISRSYYDVVSRLTSEYAQMFKYRGVLRDKHGREHQTYEVFEGQKEEFAESEGKQENSAFTINLDSISSALSAAGSPRTEESDIDIAEKLAMAALLADSAEEVSAETLVPVLSPQEIEQGKLAEVEAGARTAEELKVQQEEARLKAEAEAEARKLAEEQSVLMASAEQSAWEAAEARAQAEKERLAQLAEYEASQAKAVQPARKKRGKPLPWGKIGAGLFLLLLVLVGLLPYILPMQGFIAQLEKNLSAQLKQTVHVGSMSASLFPGPKLELHDVAVGGKQELKASSVVLNFGISTLFDESKQIQQVEIGDLTLSAEDFDQAISWMRMAGENMKYPVQRMVLQRARISGQGASFASMNGEADFDGHGHFVKAVLKKEDGKLGIELRSMGPKKARWKFGLTIKDSSLPQFPNMLFEELNANGEVGEGEANFSEIDGRLHRGKLLGNANLTWRQGWNMQGQVNVQGMDMHDALPKTAFDGELDGNANFTLHASTLPQLADSLHLDSSFVLKKGIINNVDMVETVYAAKKRASAGGRTHFDELSGRLVVDNGSQHLSQIRITSAGMSASGVADVSPDKQLSGQLQVSLKMRAGMGSVPLILSGTIAQPMLRQGR